MYALCSAVLCALCVVCARGGLKGVEWRGAFPLHSQRLYSDCTGTGFLLVFLAVLGEYLGLCLGFCKCSFNYKIASARGLAVGGHAA